MKLAVIGSRSFNDYTLLKATLSQYENISVIVSGGAKGADKLAETYAEERGLELVVFKPDWKRYNRSAGLIRNKHIVDCSDLVLAFWDGQSKGTLSSINYAKKQNKPVVIISAD